ncbi:hypothetical protein B0H99_104127 [Planomicrobium soli]|uniref:Glucosyltransferase GtrII-like protein n=1 Tax=Planomicrobium soli TaxID=1176648 RepID=A0A2P8H376_9BACL|nr:DUF6056 family protein [Planomicrobium soli]PSL40665.1 hypothetical protein B0H99_104127 [Planomicrobium soli]
MERLQKNRIRKKHWLSFFAVYVFFLFISFNTPLTGDDWTWGTDIGKQRFINNFNDYNGRYLSNIFELILVRFDAIRYLTIAFFSTLLVILIGKITNHNGNIVSLLFSFLLITLMPVKIFAQTLGWAAGFINYVPSVALLLVYLYLNRNIYGEEAPVFSKKLWILMIPLGLSTQLIVEHVTIFAVVTAVWVIIYTYLKHKKVYLVHISYMISVLLGSIVMFTNSAYLKVLTGSDAYRTVENEATANMGLFEKIYYVYSESIYKFLFLQNSFLIIIISLLLLILILRFKTEKTSIRYVAKPLLIFVNALTMAYLLVITRSLKPNFLGQYTNDFEAILSILFVISVFGAIVLFVKDHSYKTRLIYYLAAIVFLVAPFVFITPFGPRCVFASYIFMILLSLELLAYLLQEKQVISSYVRYSLVPLVAVAVIFLAFVFSMNGITSRERLVNLQEKVAEGEQKIDLVELPFPQFHWMPSPKPKMYHTKTFKMFYDIPKETELNIIPFEKWDKKE